MLAVLVFLLSVRFVTHDAYQILPSPSAQYMFIHLVFQSAEISALLRLLIMFVAGVAFYLYRERISFSRSLCAAAVGTALLVVFVRMGFTMWMATGGAYLLLFAAAHPQRHVSNFGSRGDFSYGMYIYAFPVQQSVTALFGGTMPPLLNIFIAFPVTFALAFLSWHLVEKRALRLKAKGSIRSLIYRFSRRAMSASSSSVMPR